MSYGHGPLADHVRSIDKSPEPVEFARLIQHIERGEIPACQADACGQDPTRCPCPDACRLSADSMRRYTEHRLWLAVALVAVCAFLVVVIR